MLKVQNIAFRYHREASFLFKDFSFTLLPGEYVGLKGPSGRGKTTLGKITAGFIRPVEGRVTVGELSIPVSMGKISPIQLLFQHPETAVNPRWKVKKIISEGSMADKGMLERFKIELKWLDRYPSELSSGQLARIAIVRALTPDTRYLIADEITSSLDAINQALIWKTLKAYTEKRNMGVMVISHDDMLIGRLCDRVMEI